MGKLAVVLAKESFFGKDMMCGATVVGMKAGRKPLPKKGIAEIIFFSLPRLSQQCGGI